MSATSVSPAAPPNTAAPKRCTLAPSFNLYTFSIPFRTFLPFKFTYVPAFLAFNALVASLLAIFAPAAAGTPIDTNASVILPAARCSAISSNGFIVSNTCSTFAAAFSVNSNASISSAPRDTKPSGIFKTPEATPASAASICDTS